MLTLCIFLNIFSTIFFETASLIEIRSPREPQGAQGASCLYPPISWVIAHAARLSFYVDAGDQTQFVMFRWQDFPPTSFPGLYDGFYPGILEC